MKQFSKVNKDIEINETKLFLRNIGEHPRRCGKVTEPLKERDAILGSVMSLI